MTREALANLASIGKLKAEPGAAAEIEGLLRSGGRRLEDANNGSEPWPSTEGLVDVEEGLVEAIIRVALEVQRRVAALGLPR
jgi:hypothetical protein